MKLFNKWDTLGIKVNDKALQPYINLDPLIIPRTQGRSGLNRLWTNPPPIVEKLMNKMMVPGHRGKKHKITSGHNTGKAFKIYNLVQKNF